MTTITAQERDMSIKAKKLRREGFVPGNICGKDLPESIMIQIPEKDAFALIRKNKKGSQVQVQIGEKKIHAIIKDYTYNALARKIEILDFQALAKGEKIHTSVEVILKNDTLSGGVVTQQLSEIHYKADEDHLVDTIVLDFANMLGVKSMKVSDLPQFKDPAITVSNPDATIFSVEHIGAMDLGELPEEETADAPAAAPAADAAKDQK